MKCAPVSLIVKIYRRYINFITVIADKDAFPRIMTERPTREAHESSKLIHLMLY
jgi:hypothetical protein